MTEKKPAKNGPEPGSREWQQQFDVAVAQHDREVEGTSEGQDFEIAPPTEDG